MEASGHEKLDWLRQLLALQNGVPSHDCIAYTLEGQGVSGVFREPGGGGAGTPRG